MSLTVPSCKHNFLMLFALQLIFYKITQFSTIPIIFQLSDSFSRRTLLHGVCYRHVHASPVFHIQCWCGCVFCYSTTGSNQRGKSVYVTKIVPPVWNHSRWGDKYCVYLTFCGTIFIQNLEENNCFWNIRPTSPDSTLTVERTEQDRNKLIKFGIHMVFNFLFFLLFFLLISLAVMLFCCWYKPRSEMVTIYAYFFCNYVIYLTLIFYGIFPEIISFGTFLSYI